MKGKTLLSLAIAISVMLAAMPLVAVKASPTTIEIVFENGQHYIKKTPCSNFLVNVSIVGAPDITQYIIEITWDPDLLELQTGTEADVVQGPFLRTAGGTVYIVKTPEPDRLPEVTEALLMAPPYASGSGTLFQIKFHCKAPGNATIHLTRAILLKELEVVPCDPVDGTVEQPYPTPTPPTADIKEPAQGAFVDVCADVPLDGSTSTDGYDTMPSPGHTCPITEWKWEIDFGNDGTIELTLYGKTTSFHCDSPGLAGITLTVTAPDPIPPTHPDYRTTASHKHTIMQVTPIVGPKIDVYTEKGGTGPGMDEQGNCYPYPLGWSDAFGPQEEVTVYAKVTYNEEPVEHKPVAFQMINPFGYAADFRTAFTDASGIATTAFRIPWENCEAEQDFGDWCIVATTDIAEVVVMDKVCFRYGWIVSIRDIIVTGSPLYKGEFLTIDVDLKSISMTSKHVLLTIVACDECGVPIGWAGGGFDVDPEDGVAVGYMITIPRWAFVGTGHLYVNVFTTWPNSGGVPMCREGTTIFIILKTP